MKNQGFVFNAMAFLLIIPAAILAASFLHMVQHGSAGIGLVISGDRVFYTCNNVIDFLQTGAIEGERSGVIDETLLYANQSGMNVTIIQFNSTYFMVVLQTEGGTKCNKTIELRNGTLRLNLSLEDYRALFNGVPIYVRKDANSTINITTYTTYPNNNPVDGADVVVNLLNESISGISGSNGSGYFNTSLNITTKVDTTDSCWRKALLGESQATAAANLTNWYDGTDEEFFYIWGIMYSSIAPYKRGNDMYVRVTLTDEYHDPGGGVDSYIYAENCKSETNVSYGDPYITMEIYSDNDDTTNPPDCAADPEFCPETGSAVYGFSLESGSVKRYITDTPFDFDAGWYYDAYISVTMPDYMNESGNIVHTDFRELTFWDLGVENVSYDPTVGGGKIEATITNYGTEGLDSYSLIIKYSPDNGSIWTTCLNETDSNPPSPRRASETKTCIGVGTFDLGNTNLINTTITFVAPQDEDPTDDSLEVCYGDPC